jgi:hypothetical protein
MSSGSERPLSHRATERSSCGQATRQERSVDEHVTQLTHHAPTAGPKAHTYLSHEVGCALAVLPGAVVEPLLRVAPQIVPVSHVVAAARVLAALLAALRLPLLPALVAARVELCKQVAHPVRRAAACEPERKADVTSIGSAHKAAQGPHNLLSSHKAVLRSSRRTKSGCLGLVFRLRLSYLQGYKFRGLVIPLFKVSPPMNMLGGTGLLPVVAPLAWVLLEVPPASLLISTAVVVVAAALTTGALAQVQLREDLLDEVLAWVVATCADDSASPAWTASQLHASGTTPLQSRLSAIIAQNARVAQSVLSLQPIMGS